MGELADNRLLVVLASRTPIPLHSGCAVRVDVTHNEFWFLQEQPSSAIGSCFWEELCAELQYPKEP